MTSLITRRRNTMLALLAGIAALLGVAGPAAAQFGQAAGFGEVMSPYFMRRDLNTFVDNLDLDEGQAMIIESLFFDYEDEHNASKESMLDSIKSIKDVADTASRSELLALVFKPFEQKADEWERARTQFLENVQLLLNEQQLELWPEFMRELRRTKELPKGEFSGESVDLLVTLKVITIGRRAAATIAPLLEQYALELDDALARREQLMANSRLAMMNTIRDEDHLQALELYRKQIAASMAVRDVNDRFILAIAAELPEAEAELFRTEALQRGYKRVYRPTAAQRLFTSAVKLESISEETRDAILGTEVAYLTEVGLINEELVGLIRDYEPEEAVYRAARFAAKDGQIAKPEPPSDPTRRAFNDRKQLGIRYVAMLQDLLTRSEFASLPGASRFLRGTAAGLEQDQSPKEKRKQMERRNGASGVGTGR